MKTEAKRFDELNTKELYDILALRAEVFVVEQECAYQDVDGKDQKAIHIIGWDNDEIVAYARAFGPGDYFEEASIGRVVVKNSHRTSGLGQLLIKETEKAIQNFFNTRNIELSAQSYLRKFYKDLGYEERGEEYQTVVFPSSD